MSAKVPNMGSSIRDQWPAQRVRGDGAVPETYASQQEDRLFAPIRPPASSHAAATRHGARVSPVAAGYSRYASTGRYTTRDGAAASPNAGQVMSGAHSGGLALVLPYVVYGLLAVISSVAWFVWIKATVAGSIMGEPFQFSVGIILLVAVLVLGVIVAVAAGLALRGRTGDGVFDALAVSMGKTSIGMTAFLVVWVALMLLAA